MIEISLSQGNKTKDLEESINLFRVKVDAVGEAGLIDINAIIKKLVHFLPFLSSFILESY